MALDKERQLEENKTAEQATADTTDEQAAADTTAEQATADDITDAQAKSDQSLETSTAQVQDSHNNKPDEVTQSEETTCKNCFWNGSIAIPFQRCVQLVIAENGKLGRKYANFPFFFLSINKFAFV